jgi:competence protein ComEA
MEEKEMRMTTRILMTLALAAVLAGEALAAGTAAGQINVNTATAQELQLLPRVGPSLAQRIVEFRTSNGPFKAAEELTRVKGIGEKSFALLQPYVTVQGDTTLKEKVKVPRPKKTTAEKS